MRAKVSTGSALVRWMMALLAITAVLAVAGSRDAQAQGIGFTGDLYYGGGVYGPLGYAEPTEWHSYGFNSAENISDTARGRVWSSIGQRNSSGSISWDAFAICNDFCRVCIIGTYPNCTDTDGWSGITWAQNNSSINLRLRGHGVY